jgi:ABC-type oligopeptide transport system substrate-binding subunit/class 3 adenylate cyclase
MREERRIVTALCADLVGSTRLTERLDPEEARLVVGEAVARIVHTVEAFGGTVKDLAGDGVLALFGAPTAHEDDAERAVRAGLQISDELGMYARDVERSFGIDGFGVRVGVNSGVAVVGPVGAGGRVEYGATGDVVNVAARLQAEANPGGVLVGAETKRAAENLFRWGPEQSLELKGKSSVVVACVAEGALASPASRRETRLVGRDGELAQARAAIDDVCSGAGSVVFVTGEAGIGKSRLVAELREALADTEGVRPLLWLEGRCASYGESMPYWPFRELLRDWLGVSLDDPELRTRLALRRALDEAAGERGAEFYPYLGSLLGLTLERDAHGKLAELSPEALQYRTFEVVQQWLQQLAADGPVVLALEDVHWGDPTSLQLVERLLPLTEEDAVLLLLTMRPDPDHPSWSIKELAARQFPHRTRELALGALTGDAEAELLQSLVGRDTLPRKLETRILAEAEGNPFFLEELVGSLVDSGALQRADGGWRFDHETSVEVPATVEKVILARVDRLTPECRDVLTAASVLGRHFGLPLLSGVTRDGDELRDSLRELQRLDLLRESRRWPQPEFRFKHVLIQETVYRTVVGSERRALHREAAEWLEQRRDEGGDEVLGLLAQHWLAAKDEAKAIDYLTRAGDKARQDYALDEAIEYYEDLLPLLERRGESQAVALVLFKLALALHTSMRFGEANAAYQRAFDVWRPPDPIQASELLRLGTSFLPNDADPRSAIAWPNIQLCMQLFDRLVEAWPERTIVPSLAERWEISEDGLRYVFHLREGLEWSDGHPLTAHDVEFGVKRVLNPDEPGSSVAIYFVIDGGQDYYLRQTPDARRVGVNAHDDRTVEFRLAAPAPYFLSAMNRPDGGPQPQHAIEQHGAGWAQPERQVVSGPFRIAARTDEMLTLVRRDDYRNVARTGNVERVEMVASSVPEALERYARNELDMVTVRYTPRLADQVRMQSRDAVIGAATWTGYLAFDHSHPAVANVDFRRALAHAIDREALAERMPANLLVATGGLVPPALQGHTPDIVPHYEPERARELLARSGVTGVVQLAALDQWADIVQAIAESWRSTLGVEVETPTWSPDQAWRLARPWEQFIAPIVITGWLPGYSDPEYYLRLLLHSASKTNEGGYAYAQFDELIERARQERSDRSRLELFHAADRMAVSDQVALIPLAYGRSAAFVRPTIHGWWEFGKSSASFADLTIA